MKKRRLLQGFSLVELLVVLFIVGILAVLALPAFSRVRGSAESANCANRLKQIGMVIHSYAGEHNGALPPSDETITDATGASVPDNSSGYPFQYLDSNQPWLIFSCPGDHTPGQDRWKYDGFPRRYSSYAQNYYLFVPYANYAPATAPGRNALGRKMSLNESLKKILYCDGIAPSEAATWPYGSPNVNGNGVAGALLSQWAFQTISRRHNGSANYLFGDGSVRLFHSTDVIDYATYQVKPTYAGYFDRDVIP